MRRSKRQEVTQTDKWHMEGTEKLQTSLNIKMITTRNKDGRNMQQELGRREMFER